MANMQEIDQTAILRKGKKINLTWNEKNFKTNFFGTSDFECRESPVFQTEESSFKISLAIFCKKYPGKFFCVLTKLGMHALKSAEYDIDFEITIDGAIWTVPEQKLRFKEKGEIIVIEMNLAGLELEDKFQTECEITCKFGLRRIKFIRSCARSASAVTEIPVTSILKILNYQNVDFKTCDELIQEGTIRVDAAANSPLIKKHCFKMLTVACYTSSHCTRTILFKAEKVPLFYKLKIRVIDTRKNIEITSIKSEEFILVGDIHYFDTQLTKSYLQELENSPSEFDPITIYIVVSSSIDDPIETIKFEHCFSTCTKKVSNLKSDLRNISFNMRCLPDFTLRVGEKIVSVRRDILAARSPVFKTILMNDMLESRIGLLKMTNMNYDVLISLLRFIYSSDLQKNLDYQDVATLYETADQYGILSLQSVCRKDLIKLISFDNFDYLLILSHLHTDRKFKDSIISILHTWNFDADVISRLDNMINFDTPLTEVDMHFLAWIKQMFICIKT